MRIVIDGHMLGDHSGGNESHYTNLLNAIEVDKNDEVFLLVKPQIDIERYKNKFNIIRFGDYSAAKRNFVEIDKICKKTKADVLHAQYFIPFIRSCKVVCSIHDICFEHYSNIFTRNEYLRQKILVPYAAHHSEKIFTLSEHAKNDISTHYSIKPEKILVTNCAVSANFRKLTIDQLDEADLRKKYGIGDEPYILSVGNLQPRKNLPRLIEAFNIWKRTGQEGKLVIVGKKAWMYSEIFKAVSVKSDDIVFTDYVTEHDLIRLYNAAHCFIYPSFYEGFGLPPLEAMACEKPVAVANATSLPEVVGEAGLYFDPFDVSEIASSISELMTNNKKCNELIEKSHTQVKKFSWKNSAKLIYEAYHNV